MTEHPYYYHMITFNSSNYLYVFVYQTDREDGKMTLKQRIFHWTSVVYKRRIHNLRQQNLCTLSAAYTIMYAKKARQQQNH